MDPVTRRRFSEDLCPLLRPVVDGLMDCDCGCEVVDFFRFRHLTWAEAPDIAAHLQCPLEQVGRSLDQLVQAEIIERAVILNEVFYSLTRNARSLNALEQFWLMRDDWRERLEQARETLRLRALEMTSQAYLSRR